MNFPLVPDYDPTPHPTTLEQSTPSTWVLHIHQEACLQGAGARPPVTLHRSRGLSSRGRS